MTPWQRGLMRLTRNQFSFGGAGSNPAGVVFFLLFFFSSTFQLSFI